METLKEERISIRTSSELKKLIAAAADSSNVTFTDFLLAAGRKAAEQVIAESERIVLNNAERDRLLSLLDNPPAPSEKLKAAALRHQAHLKL